MNRATLLHSLLLASAAAAAQEDRDHRPAARLSVGACEIELEARWQPLTDTVYGFDRSHRLLRELAPARARATWRGDHFRPLLPDHAVAVGDVWRVDVDHLLPFLRQLHSGATKEMHHDHGSGVSAPGAFACLRAVDDDRAEVWLRAHVDFRIDGDGTPGQSSWFTPAQFRGTLQLDRRSGAVVAFELGVPDQSANVDVNIASGGHVVADIGRVPQMEVAGGERVELAASADAIDGEAAAALLARAFYPFAAIEWLDLPAALARARTTGKPLHVLALFGSLLDESC